MNRTQAALASQDVAEVLRDFLDRGDLDGPLHAPGSAKYFSYPGDYRDPLTFLGDLISRLPDTEKVKCQDLAFSAVKQALSINGADRLKFVHRVLALIARVPALPRDVADLSAFCIANLNNPNLREQPDPGNDIHRELLMLLAKPDLPDPPRSFLKDIIRYLSEGPYAVAAFSVLVARDPALAIAHLVQLLRWLQREKIDFHPLAFRLSKRLGGDNVQLWSEFGRALREGPGQQLLPYLKHLLEGWKWIEAHRAFAEAVEAPQEGKPESESKPISVPTFNAMLTLNVLNRQGETVGTVEIDPADFGGEINRQLLHDAVLMYQANQRAGTHSTLRRGEVAGSTKKLFRQKGTGNARAGTRRTNKRRGGGTAKGPKPRDYEYHLPKKAVRAATRMAILSKFQDQEAVILDELALGEVKTKQVSTLLKALNLKGTTCLIGTTDYDRNLYLSSRNIPEVEVMPTSQFNAYTVLKQRRLVLTRAALETLRTGHQVPALTT